MLDSYYFDNQTIPGADYNDLVDIYVRVQAPKFPRNVLFRQDRAPPHTNRQARALPNEVLSDFWIGKYGPYYWPPRSPDLTLPDFSLRERVTDKVYRTLLQNVTQLKRRIHQAVRRVTQEMPENVW